MLEKAQRGRFGYDNMLSYLTHIKYPDKFQYDPNDVVTIYGKKYSDIYNERRVEWLHGRAKVQTQKAKASVDYVVSEIVAGNLTKRQVLLTPELRNVYQDYRNRVNDAIKTFAEVETEKMLMGIESGEFKTTVIFVTGKSRAGKSHFVKKQLVPYIQNKSREVGSKKTWRAVKLASRNMADNINGEEILIIDDGRGSKTGSASFWLNFLDPTDGGYIEARYNNRIIVARVIIIISYKNPFEFFDFPEESMDQFIDRIDCCAEISVDDNKDHWMKINDSYRTKETFYKEIIPEKESLPIRIECNYDFGGDENEYSIEKSMEILLNKIWINNGFPPTTPLMNKPMLFNDSNETDDGFIPLDEATL